VGDAGGHDGTGRDSDDSGLSVADEPPDLPLSSDCGPGCRTASTALRVQLEIWIRHVIAARLIGLWLTPDLFRLRRVTWKSTPSNQGCLLLVGPSFLGFPHSGDAPWARRHPPSMAGGGSRGIHAARPTARRLRSACTQVAICVVRTGAHEDQDQKPLGVGALRDPCGRRRRSRRQR
jgi:hypothetical protein